MTPLHEHTPFKVLKQSPFQLDGRPAFQVECKYCMSLSVLSAKTLLMADSCPDCVDTEKHSSRKRN